MKTESYSNTALTPGYRYRIKRFGKVDSHYKSRLMAMGLLPNAVFSVIRRSPLGQAIEISLGDYQLSLRANELTEVECEVLS